MRVELELIKVDHFTGNNAGRLNVGDYVLLSPVQARMRAHDCDVDPSHWTIERLVKRWTFVTSFPTREECLGFLAMRAWWSEYGETLIWTIGRQRPIAEWTGHMLSTDKRGKNHEQYNT